MLNADSNEAAASDNALASEDGTLRTTGSSESQSKAPLTGEVRRLPAGYALRTLQAVSLWLFASGMIRFGARYLLGYRQKFELTTQSKQLLLNRKSTIWGRTMSTQCTVLPLAGLQEITLEKNGESPAFSAGLVALGVGSFFGVQLLVQALRAPGAAWSLWGTAALVMAIGVILDFFWGSGRTLSTWNGPARLVLKVEGSRGWVLSGLKAEEAQATVDWAQGALAGESFLAPVSNPLPRSEKAGPKVTAGPKETAETDH